MKSSTARMRTCERVLRLHHVVALTAGAFSAMPQRTNGLIFVLLTHFASAAVGGPWNVISPTGQVVEIIKDDSRGDPGIFLDKRRADGEVDPRFGAGGYVPLVIAPGKQTPTSLALDTASRIYVTANVREPDQLSRVVILRFTMMGIADRTWGDDGRSEASPFGLGARVFDILPLSDDYVLVLGAIEIPGTHTPLIRLSKRDGLSPSFTGLGQPPFGVADSPSERAALWRLDKRGQLDPDFVDSGCLALDGDEPSRGVSLARADDGRILIGVYVLSGGKAVLEVRALDRPNKSTPTLLARQPLPSGWTDSPILIQRTATWHWIDPKGRDKRPVPLVAISVPEITNARVLGAAKPATDSPEFEPAANRVAATGNASDGTSWGDDVALWVLASVVIPLVGYIALRLLRGRRKGVSGG